MKSKFVVYGKKDPRSDDSVGSHPGNVPDNSTITASAKAVIV